MSAAEDRLERVRWTAGRLRELGSSAVETTRLLGKVAFASIEAALRFESVAKENEELRAQLAALDAKCKTLKTSLNEALEIGEKHAVRFELLAERILSAPGIWTMTQVIEELRKERQ